MTGWHSRAGFVAFSFTVQYDTAVRDSRTVLTALWTAISTVAIPRNVFSFGHFPKSRTGDSPAIFPLALTVVMQKLAYNRIYRTSRHLVSRDYLVYPSTVQKKMIRHAQPNQAAGTHTPRRWQLQGGPLASKQSNASSTAAATSVQSVFYPRIRKARRGSLSSQCKKENCSTCHVTVSKNHLNTV